jgi:hypothetical protein
VRSAVTALWHAIARPDALASSQQPGTRRPLGPGPCTRLTCSGLLWVAAAVAAVGAAVGAAGEVVAAGEVAAALATGGVRYRGEGEAHRFSLAAVGSR